jgi:hypothetical protein
MPASGTLGSASTAFWRDAPYTLERGGLAAGQGQVHEGARAERKPALRAESPHRLPSALLAVRFTRRARAGSIALMSATRDCLTALHVPTGR